MADASASASRDISSITRSRGDESSGLDFVSTITRVPPSIDVLVPEPPPADPPSLEEQQTMESRIAMKIVRERLEHHQSQAEEAVLSRETSRATSASGPSLAAQESNGGPTLQRAQTEQSTPGAVRVAGINSRSSLGESEISDQTRSIGLSLKSSDAPFEPEVPVEAELVDRSRQDNNELVEAEPMEPTQFTCKDVVKNRKVFAVIVVIVMAIVALAVGLTVGLIRRSSNNSTPSDLPVDDSANNTNSTMFNAIIQTPFSDKLLEISVEIIVSDATSPQALANTWMVNDPNLETYSVNRSLARYGLATFYFATQGPKWHNQSGWLRHDLHECLWYMSHPESVCDDWDRHTIVNLTSNGLAGAGSTRELVYYLWYVDTLDLSNNSLSGPPPPLISERPGYKYIDYSKNFLQGRISAEFGYTNDQLETLRIQDNLLSGPIPPNLYFILPNAQEIDLSRNRFSGAIPDQILRNNTVLRKLLLEENRLTGKLPTSLEHLVELEILDVSGNRRVTGTIPNELSACQDLVVLDIEGTSLTGSIPAGLCQLEASDQLHVIADCNDLTCC